MKKILIALLIMASVFSLIVFADAEVDYETLYMSYAQNNGEMFKGTSGMIMLDINDDVTPELLTFITVTAYDGATHYELDKAFSIIDGAVVEGTPWVNKAGEKWVVRINYLPGVYEETDSRIEILKETKTDLKSLYINYLGEDSKWAVIKYDGKKFAASNGTGKFDTYFGNITEKTTNPVTSCTNLDYYSGYTKNEVETMQVVLQNYKALINYKTLKVSDGKSVRVSDWAAGEISQAIEKGLILDNMADDDLTENITRAEFAGIAVHLYEKMTGEKIETKRVLIRDIDNSEYSNYIIKAYVGEITTGTSSDPIMFSPDLNITREQLATMFCRTIKKSKFDGWSIATDGEYKLDISGVNSFADDSAISDYARESVYYMNKHGIIKGVDSTSFAPAETATKEQAILLALRIYNSPDLWTK